MRIFNKLKNLFQNKRFSCYVIINVEDIYIPGAIHYFTGLSGWTLNIAILCFHLTLDYYNE